MQRDLYILDHFRDIHDTTSSSVDLSSFLLSNSSSVFYLWHSRLGHVFGSRLRFVASIGALRKLDVHDISDCSGCKLAKFSTLPFNNSVSSSNAPFDLVHSDVFSLNLNDSKSIVAPNGDLMLLAGIGSIDTPYVALTDVYHLPSLIMNLAYHHHLVELARCFLFSADFPSVFWGEAVLTATYVINRYPTAHNSSLSPFEKLYGTLSDYSSLRVFGYTCFVLKPHVKRTKLSSKSTLCVNLGYGSGNKGYRCYDPVGKNSFIAFVHRLHKPLSYREAVFGSLWQVAIAEELAALHQT
ncbi:gag-pol polyprotein [Tanacetum coccineum]